MNNTDGDNVDAADVPAGIVPVSEVVAGIEVAAGEDVTRAEEVDEGGDGNDGEEEAEDEIGHIFVHSLTLNGMYTRQQVQVAFDASPWAISPLVFPLHLEGNYSQTGILRLLTAKAEDNEEVEVQVAANQDDQAQVEVGVVGVGVVVEDMAEEEVMEEEEVVSEGAGGQPITDGHDAVAMAVEVQVAGVEGGVAVDLAVSVHAVALNGFYTRQDLELIRDATPWGQMPLPLF
ncbi:hypothetical protein B484DRAFT_466364, partial [Ochromonadaceae sp. CCMP2298]